MFDFGVLNSLISEKGKPGHRKNWRPTWGSNMHVIWKYLKNCLCIKWAFLNVDKASSQVTLLTLHFKNVINFVCYIKMLRENCSNFLHICVKCMGSRNTSYIYMCLCICNVIEIRKLTHWLIHFWLYAG
jgi:hypothetical protein